uniref:Rhodanese domain-containing protein n=1 Tax=Strombidinopsis acuminata TaxID=141414 RepID=A0A7S3TPS8_9SPIT
MKATALILLALRVVGSSACATDITDVDAFLNMEASFDLVIDVRNWDEYTGSGDAACNSGGDARKCDYGHHPSMSFLENPFRADKAAVYKVDNANTVEMAVVDALKRCYGTSIGATKIMTSCHSGSRSGFFQDKLVEAGFACANVYNFVPGARGIYQAWEAGNFSNATLMMLNETGNPGRFDYSACPFDTSGTSNTTSDPQVSGASGAAPWGLGLTAFLVGLLA